MGVWRYRGRSFWRNDRKKHRICVIIGICFAVIVTGILIRGRILMVQEAVRQTQTELAEEVFRFHVLANSDSQEDQEVKLKVRDAVLAYMEGQTGTGLPLKADAAQTEAWARNHLEEIQKTAQKTLEQEGYFYGAEAEITECMFPDKRYGDLYFPAGRYRALRICLGRARGQNWWCALYPRLCFTDAVCAVVDEEGKQELRKALTSEEYEMVTATSEFKIKWFFFGGLFEEEQKEPGGSHDD